KWLTDITEFHIPAGKVYLSPIIDCFDGLPVSWTIGTSPDAELVNTMLDNAVSILNENEHPIVHSDRGCHYRWPGWIERMEKAGLTRSMSKKGCSPDNSACEGFFGRLKNEMFYGRSWQDVTIEEFIAVLDDYIHWYAEKRIKLSLGGLSPIQYRIKLGLIAT
nr:IS3 family transposase [Lachnospiraceae bacterium]